MDFTANNFSNFGLIKGLISLALFVFVLLSFTACSENENSQNEITGVVRSGNQVIASSNVI